MSDRNIEKPDEPEASLRKPVRKTFRRSFQAERPSREQMARQGRLARSAWTAFGERDAVMAFLNTHHEALGGRPIDLALTSDEAGPGRAGDASGGGPGLIGRGERRP